MNMNHDQLDLYTKMDQYKTQKYQIIQVIDRFILKSILKSEFQKWLRVLDVIQQSSEERLAIIKACFGSKINID